MDISINSSQNICLLPNTVNSIIINYNHLKKYCKKKLQQPIQYINGGLAHKKMLKSVLLLIVASLLMVACTGQSQDGDDYRPYLNDIIYEPNETYDVIFEGRK